MLLRLISWFVITIAENDGDRSLEESQQSTSSPDVRIIKSHLISLRYLIDFDVSKWRKEMNFNGEEVLANG